MEASLLRRLSHSTASTSGAQQPLPARCQRSHCAWGRPQQHGAHHPAAEQQRRCDPSIPRCPRPACASCLIQVRATMDRRAARRRRDGSQWVLSAAGPAEPPELSASASSAEQSESSWERRTSDGAEAGKQRRDDAGSADEADDEGRPEDWYNQLLEQGFSEVCALLQLAPEKCLGRAWHFPRPRRWHWLIGRLSLLATHPPCVEIRAVPIPHRSVRLPMRDPPVGGDRGHGVLPARAAGGRG